MLNYILNRSVASLKASATLRINELSQKIANSGKNVFRLGFGRSPFPVPRHIVRVLADHTHQKGYMPVGGFYPLKEAVSEYWQRTQGLDFQPENILVGPGSKELLFLRAIASRNRRSASSGIRLRGRTGSDLLPARLCRFRWRKSSAISDL